MKIILESEDHRAEIETKHDDLTIWDVWEELVRPVLIAYGFGERIVG